jgi:phage-related protein
MVMSDDGVKASADFVDAQTTLQMTMTGLKNRLTAEFLPACTDVTNGIAKMFSGDMSGLEDIKKGIGEFVGSIAEHVPVMIQKGGELFVGFIQGLAEKIPELATTAAEAIRNFAENFGQDSEGGSELIAKAGELMFSLGSALMEAASVLIPAVVELIWNFFSETDWLGLSLSVAQSLFDGFLDILPQAVEFIGNFVSNVLDLMGFSGLADNVRSLFEDIKSKITTPIESAKGIVDSAVSKIKGFFPISIGRILDNISLPHFEVYGGEFPYGIGGSGSPPSFDVWWGANGGIMNQPTLFGAGEAGPEAIMPLDPFWERMDNMADSIIQSVDSANSGEIVVNLYMYPNGPQMDQQIVRAYDRGKRRGLK